MARLSRKLLLGSISKELANRFLKDRGRELSDAIRAGLPESYGYLLVLHDAEGSAFFTDATKEEAIASLEEVLEHLKKGPPKDCRLKAHTSSAGYDRGVVVLSLAMHFDKTPNGRCAVIADWMDEPFEADSWEACYEEALRQRRTPRPRLESAAE